ncbi:IS66-like element accessory protein TnpA [Rhodospirillum sp. A1_3_36]|uniref:IS66-like element accessory protein TnpA n=1 Tax=Rhodospirillum sp. A1_3_36 TaxID=3391666 RepID=UPI0039A77CAE
MAHECSLTPTGRRRWTGEVKRRLVEEVVVSGLSVSVVAQRHGIHPSVLGRWYRALGPAGKKAASDPTLVPVRVLEPPAPEAPSSWPSIETRSPSVIEIHLSNGSKVIVPEDIPLDRLRDLLSVVAGR